MQGCVSRVGSRTFKGRGITKKIVGAFNLWFRKLPTFETYETETTLELSLRLIPALQQKGAKQREYLLPQKNIL